MNELGHVLHVSNNHYSIRYSSSYQAAEDRDEGYHQRVKWMCWEESAQKIWYYTLSNDEHHSSLYEIAWTMESMEAVVIGFTGL